MKRHLLAVGLLVGCATPAASQRAGEYAAALRSGKLDQAYALTSAAYRSHVTRKQYEAELSRPGAASARASEVDRAYAELSAAVPELSHEVTAVSESEARATLERFVAAAEARHFGDCYALLAAPLRARYTAQTLEEDFAREPLARTRVARVRAALGGALRVTNEGAELPLGDGHAARVVREGTELKVAALE